MKGSRTSRPWRNAVHGRVANSLRELGLLKGRAPFADLGRSATRGPTSRDVVDRLETLALEVEDLKRISRRTGDRAVAAAKKREEWAMRRAARLERLVAERDLVDDPAFLDAAEEVALSRRTFLDFSRMAVLWQAAQNTADLPGPVADVGTWRGGAGAIMAASRRAAGAPDPQLYLFDLFPPEEDKGFVVSAGDVCDYVGRYTSRVDARAGDVADTLGQTGVADWSLAHVDVNRHDATAAALSHLLPRMRPGAIVVVDDYRAASCPGILTAITEVRRTGPPTVLLQITNEQAVLVRV